MRDLIRSSAVVAAAAILLTACSSASADTSDVGPSTSGGGSGGTLIVYTNSNTDGRTEWLTTQAAEAGFTVEVVGQGGGDTTNKIITEKNNPVADVVFGLNDMYFSQLVDADTLEAYTPAWSEEVDPGLVEGSGSGMYWPIVQQGIVLAYDAAAYSTADAPQDWTDLWSDPRFAGRFESVTGLGGATTQLVIAGILTRYQDTDGDLGVSAEGWAQIEGYFDKGSPAVPDQDLYARIAAGDVDMGQMWTSGIPARDQEYGLTTAVMTPEVGVPFAVEQVAVVKGTERADDAHEFIDWFGSAEVQAAWSAEFDSMPANTGALSRTDPAIAEFHQGLVQQDIDWEFVGKNISGWMEKIELEYVK